MKPLHTEANTLPAPSVGSGAWLGSVVFIDCAAFLRRPERKKAGTMIVMRPGVTSQQVVDTARKLGMTIRWARKEETSGRGGAIFLVLPNTLAEPHP